jgi:hypothetical protein
MAVQDHRRVVNQQGVIIPERDRMFGEALRRLLLKVVAMIEDRYGLDRVNLNRTSKTLR